ncbi:hypothetical protein Bbelb_162440, partial [Branchiostoma belcheri]
YIDYAAAYGQYPAGYEQYPAGYAAHAYLSPAAYAQTGYAAVQQPALSATSAHFAHTSIMSLFTTGGRYTCYTQLFSVSIKTTAVRRAILVPTIWSWQQKILDQFGPVNFPHTP